MNHSRDGCKCAIDESGIPPTFCQGEQDAVQIQLGTPEPLISPITVTPGCLSSKTRWNVAYGNLLSWIAMHVR